MGHDTRGKAPGVSQSFVRGPRQRETVVPAEDTCRDGLRWGGVAWGGVVRKGASWEGWGRPGTCAGSRTSPLSPTPPSFNLALRRPNVSVRPFDALRLPPTS